jgi:hypothetical protein
VRDAFFSSCFKSCKAREMASSLHQARRAVVVKIWPVGRLQRCDLMMDEVDREKEVDGLGGKESRNHSPLTLTVAFSSASFDDASTILCVKLKYTSFIDS